MSFSIWPVFLPLTSSRRSWPTSRLRNNRALCRACTWGRVVSEYQDERARGDYLIRNVLGVDRASGAIAVGDLVRPGQTVQFHIRDADAADQDLGHLLGKARDRCADQPARGALLFTCNGRGSNLFDEPDHDAGLLSFCLGRIPTAGFFAAGELGPIGGKNYLHGYTASIALFAPLPD